MQALSRNWWLLALSGVLEAVISVIYLTRQDADAASSFHGLHTTVVFLGKLTLAAGACTIAAGFWSSRMLKSALLVLNGLACSALGLIFAFWTGPLAFRTVALLIIVMAVSIGVYDLITAQTFRRRLVDEWLLKGAGVVSIGFALVFFAFVFGWMKLQPASPAQSLHWLGSYFAVNAICMLALAFCPENLSLSQTGQWQAPRGWAIRNTHIRH